MEQKFHILFNTDERATCSKKLILRNIPELSRYFSKHILWILKISLKN